MNRAELRIALAAAEKRICDLESEVRLLVEPCLAPSETESLARARLAAVEDRERRLNESVAWGVRNRTIELSAKLREAERRNTELMFELRRAQAKSEPPVASEPRTWLGRVLGRS